MFGNTHDKQCLISVARCRDTIDTRTHYLLRKLMDIRPCTAHDFEQIVPLLQQLWPNKTFCVERLRAAFSNGLASDTQFYFCAVEEGRLAAFCAISLRNNLRVEGTLANLDEIVVDKVHRGHGLGSRLLQAVITFAKERGCARLELESAFHRVETHAFYERRGFVRRAYYFSLPLS